LPEEDSILSVPITSQTPLFPYEIKSPMLNIPGTPFISFSLDRSEKHENKKRWLNPRGFISSVNKYSGINL
jgi:hypothetical protein